MAARVLHFGFDDCHRVQVLQRAGYAVAEANTLDALELHLQQPEAVDAVVISEDSPHTTERAAEIARKRTLAPVILFRRTRVELDEHKFDRVYDWYATPWQWLSDTAELIARSQMVRDSSARLREESAAVREESQRQLTRSLELTRSKPNGFPGCE